MKVALFNKCDNSVINELKKRLCVKKVQAKIKIFDEKNISES